MMNFNVKEIAKQVGAGLLVIFIVIAAYVYSWLTGGNLTTARSCSSQYINGEYDLKALRGQCPNLKQEDLVKAVEDYFQKYETDASPAKQILLQDIKDNY